MKKIHFVFCLLIGVFYFACKKDIKDTGNSNPPGVTDTTTKYSTKDIQVLLPAGVSIDLTTCEVQSLSANSKIDNSGKSSIAFNKGYPNIAYVFDKDDNLLMAGFITDSSATIDAASTAKVLLYFGYNISLQPYEITEKFITSIEKVPGVNEWITQYSTLFTQDPLVISKGNFVEPLKAKMIELVTRDTLNIRARKASDIQVDANDIKSGLQIAEDGLSNFSITNTYRRRAHAFLYKMSSKDVSDIPKEIIILPSIESNTTADMDFIVDPAGGITSFIGTVGAWFEGKGMDFFAVKTGPKELALNDNESEAVYKLRVIGPGASLMKGSLTDNENSKLTRLEIETFAMDFLFPVMLEIVGNKDDLDEKFKTDIGLNGIKTFVDKTEILLKALPPVYEQLRQSGDYKLALQKCLEALLESGNGKYFADMVTGTSLVLEMIIQQQYYIPGNVDVLAEIKQKLNVLKVVDLCLFASDIIRIGGSILASDQLEEWKIVAKSSQVALSPNKKTLIPYEQLKISAIIKNLALPDDVHPFFEWSTTAKYGKLTDTKGHTNLASFNSEDKDVFYVSKVSNASLSNGDNLDYIYVAAYVGGKKIGTDTAVVNIKKDEYKIMPDAITASGKDGAYNNKVALYLEKVKGANGITQNDTVDYKIIWTIGGTYGKLSGKGVNNINVLTVYNSNQAWYECLDKDTKEGIENVKALIYRKNRSEPESAYILFDEAEGTIKINNDPKIITKVVPVTYTTKILTESVGNWAAFPTVKFEPNPDAKSYKVRLFGFSGGFASPPEGKIYAWDEGKLPPTPYNIYPETLDIHDGFYYMVFGRTWCGGACEESSTNTWIANYKKGYGSPMAEVTITLK